MLSLFFNEPRREYGVREAARLLAVAPATASAKLQALAREGLVARRAFRRTHLYRAADTAVFRLAKRHDLLKKIHEKLLPALNERFWEPTVVLFGSGSRGEDVDEIDLLVLTEKPGSFSTTRYEKALGRRIDLFVHRNLSEIPNEHLIYNILNGITIQGDAEWIVESVSIRTSGLTTGGRPASANSATRKKRS